jgi:predicted RNA-binding protein YlqC (UPF0109 family)
VSDEFIDEVGGPGNRIEGGTAKGVIEYVAKSIVDTPEAVDVTAKERGDGIELLIAADPDDMGRLIGKRGRVIQAMRQVARAAGAADGVTTSGASAGLWLFLFLIGIAPELVRIGILLFASFYNTNVGNILFAHELLFLWDWAARALVVVIVLATTTGNLKDAQAIFKQTTGLTFRAFGAPFNQADDATIAAMDAVPELTIWMYPPKNETKRKALGRSLNIEPATGKVSYALFAKEYAVRKPASMMLLQGHCGMWSDDSFKDFVKIATLLKQDGWTTLTASQYVEKAGKR